MNAISCKALGGGNFKNDLESSLDLYVRGGVWIEYYCMYGFKGEIF